jgi:hypothetical protein
MSEVRRFPASTSRRHHRCIDQTAASVLLTIVNRCGHLVACVTVGPYPHRVEE